MTRNTKVWLSVLGGGLFVLLLCCSGVILFFYRIAEGPENIAVSVECPIQVRVNETFTITVRVTNEDTIERELHSIDVYDSYLEGITITSSDPPWSETKGSFGYLTCYFQTLLPPGAEKVVTFQAQALKAGDFSGDLDVCIDTQFLYITQVLRTLVGEE